MPDLITLATAVPPPDCFAPKGPGADHSSVMLTFILLSVAFALFTALTCSGSRRWRANVRSRVRAYVSAFIDRSFEAK